MRRSARSTLLRVAALCAICSLAVCAARAGEPRWTVPRTSEPPITTDGGHLVEGTSTAPEWSWRAHLGARYAYGGGLADRSSRALLDFAFGLGLPLDLEAALAMPLGWTVGEREPADLDAGHRELVGMGASGWGIGDLRAALLWSCAAADDGGLGFLLGLEAGIPTGDHERLLGEGGLWGDAFAALAFQVLGARASLNLGYRLRPRHAVRSGSRRFEQDDEVFWRLALRIPKKHDVAWSLEAAGAVVTATGDGPWPEPDSRPVWLGGGVDFPITRLHRLGLFLGFGVAGEEPPLFSAGLRFSWQPVLPDEDGDGIRGARDECPLMAEDYDGFEDEDGCPDLDNDEDGFPDDEDACPDKPAESFSDDGC
ncbi:MAG: hypothetical protein R6V85_09095 [Polyangia bacterium]